MPPIPSSISDPVVLMLVIIMVILLLIIGLLANVVIGAATYYYEKQKEQKKEEEKKNSALTAGVVTTLLLLCMTAPVFAQDGAAETTAAVETATSFGALSATAFYLVAGVIAIELLVIAALLYQLRVFISKTKKVTAAIEGAEVVVAPKKESMIWWRKINRFRPQEQEAQIDLGHDYDGIRELDNRLPPWWLYGFYITIAIAGIYLWRYHVSNSAPLSAEEYMIAVKEAEVQKAAYLKKTANNVDETNVKLLTEASALENGKTVFVKNCAACHGQAGEGTVGPNLTDDYWLHGGSISDVFKTVKYGYPEKGMRSWKEDLSPVQMAQVASYIKSLHGTNPANPKEKQGELYQDTQSAGAQPDSSATSVTLR
ncbi:MAG: cbb3-type cytochrome c oxidase N-terminal domain-containing protein [Candidatus Pseudobacter hemicellulosilyticus]|uniref:Cbb3-type cytochrome c oxidase N-terminal domain-containing protein n=1 Tax=Candidatus Pseudobacter hemicellulosilyticus TaxID=3121375 RepID=A0AAJ5WL27_9BACT|nr:MAG: cbb3-type cytochrome c oxidase N-terminal domain-containing protein [Pseudobacter sp.]